MNVVVEDDDSHHHPHAEQHGVRVGEATAVLPATLHKKRHDEIMLRELFYSHEDIQHFKCSMKDSLTRSRVLNQRLTDDLFCVRSGKRLVN